MRTPGASTLFGAPLPWTINLEPYLVAGHAISPNCGILPLPLHRLHNDAASPLPVGKTLAIPQVRVFRD